MSIDLATIELWAARSRKCEVCGIYLCQQQPTVRCSHCENWYCEEHKFVIDTPGHRPKYSRRM